MWASGTAKPSTPASTGWLQRLHDNDTSLVKLDLNECVVEDATALARALRANTVLTQLDVRSSALRGAQLTEPLEALQGHPSLRTLVLASKALSPIMSSLAALLAHTGNAIQQLDLGGKRCRAFLFADVRTELGGLGAEDARTLTAALTQNTALRMLKLGWNSLGDEGARVLADYLERNPRLQQLWLENNDLTFMGACALAGSLMRNTVLQTLRLYCTDMGDAGARAYADALAANSSLLTLHLDQGGYGAEGATALAAALRRNVTLTSLDVSSNELGAAGAQALCAALAQHPTLTALSMGAVLLQEEGVAAVAALLRANTPLLSLDLACNAIHAAGASELAAALQCNTTLTELRLPGNDMGFEGHCALRETVAEHNLVLLSLPGVPGVDESLERNATRTVERKQRVVRAEDACARFTQLLPQCRHAAVIVLGLKRFNRSAVLRVGPPLWFVCSH